MSELVLNWLGVAQLAANFVAKSVNFIIVQAQFV